MRSCSLYRMGLDSESRSPPLRSGPSAFTRRMIPMRKPFLLLILPKLASENLWTAQSARSSERSAGNLRKSEPAFINSACSTNLGGEIILVDAVITLESLSSAVTEKKNIGINCALARMRLQDRHESSKSSAAYVCTLEGVHGVVIQLRLADMAPVKKPIKLVLHTSQHRLSGVKPTWWNKGGLLPGVHDSRLGGFVCWPTNLEQSQ